MSNVELGPPMSGPARRAPSTGDAQGVFVLPRQKSRSRDRRESRMFLVDGQLFWSDDTMGLIGGKRHSSVASFAPGSSMDLSGIGQSIDSSGGGGSGSEELISYRIKWCRDSIAQLKRQTWPMERKLQTLKACKSFIKQHQGELKQSKQAKDVLTSTNAMFERYWRHFKREFANFLVIITPWEMRIKKIESHFGSVVASYFTFLRWIFWLNLANSLVLCSFVLVPELIENSPDITGMRKGILGMVRPPGPDGKPPEEPDFNPTLGEIWEFEGFLKSSPIFYGYYSNVEISRSGFWRNPLAYLLSVMLTYLFCFFCISRKLSQNNKLSRAGSKDDEYTFCWTVFVGWDFMIGNSETAYNKTSSLIMNLKEGILEEKEQTKDRDWRLLLRRILANLISILLIVSSAYVVTFAVQRSENLPEDATLLQKNELQLVMSGIQFIFPPLFDAIGFMEGYHPRKALNWQLGRILSLDFLNFYTLMFSLFGTVAQMGVQLNEVSGNITLLRQNETYYKNLFTSTTTTTTTTPVPSTTTTTSISNITEFINVTMNSNITNATIPSNTTLTMIHFGDSQNSTSVSIMNITQIINTTESGIIEAQTSTTQSSSTSETSSILSSTSSVDMSSETSSGARTTTQSSTTTLVSSTNINQEEDYPDVNELIQVAGDRVKSTSSQTRIKKSTNSKDLKLTDDMHSSRVFNGAFIPPLRDPYRPSLTPRPPVSGYAMPDLSDEEEPIEGRLGQKDDGPNEVRPPSTPAPGIARPIGGIYRGTTRKRPPFKGTVNIEDDDTDYDDDKSTGTNENDVRVSQSLPDLANSSTEPSSIQSATTFGIGSEPFTEVTGIKPLSDITPTNTSFVEINWNVESSTSKGEGSKSVGQEQTTNHHVSNHTSIHMNKTNSGTKMSLNVSKKIEGSDDDSNCQKDCTDIPDFKNQEILGLNDTLKDKLKSLCWETMFGQEMVKIVVMDLVMTVVSAIAFEFMRACFVRYCNRFFFWDLERGLPGYQDFKIAENVLHLVNNQSTVWMGMFFAPGLPAINTIKLAVLMYVRSWAVLTCNIPHETVFKVSKSNNFYYLILLLNLIICIMPVAYAVTWIRPSWHCGPFGGECRMYLVLTKLIKKMLPPEVNAILKYLTSPGTVIPMIILLILIIYYLSSTLSSSKEANKELKAQLKKDKDQEGAVPEITSTSVVDTTPTAAPAPIPPAPLASTTIGQSEPSQVGLATLTSHLSSMTTAQASNLSGLKPSVANDSVQKTKSLLLPPPNPI